MVEKASLAEALDRTTYLPNRTPEMMLTGDADAAFTDIGPYRDGTISVGFYSGSSEWERHPVGDEIVMAIEGHTTLVILVDGEQRRIDLAAGELVVVPQGCWHRFENSRRLKVMGVTPQPSDHCINLPEA
jgi:mannose-6-phosphate isomerase-like protein (cupin superfamily)